MNGGLRVCTVVDNHHNNDEKIGQNVSHSLLACMAIEQK